MAPVLSFLSEESYGYMKGAKAESVLLLDFPTAPEVWNNTGLVAKFDEILKVRTEVQKVLEGLRAQKTIGSSLEAQVEISADGKTYQALNSHSDLREMMIVSHLVLRQGPLSVKARKADGEKCVRCWVYSTEISKAGEFPAVCPKCLEALKG